MTIHPLNFIDLVFYINIQMVKFLYCKVPANGKPLPDIEDRLNQVAISDLRSGRQLNNHCATVASMYIQV